MIIQAHEEKKPKTIPIVSAQLPGVMQQPVEDGGGDHASTEYLAPGAEAILTSNQTKLL